MYLKKNFVQESDLMEILDENFTQGIHDFHPFCLSKRDALEIPRTSLDLKSDKYQKTFVYNCLMDSA